MKKRRKALFSVILALLTLVCVNAPVFAADTYDAEVTFENEAVRGSIQVTKYKEDNKTPLAGVTFKLTSDDGTVAMEQTTGSDGKILFEELMPGRYTLTETKTTEGNTLLKDPVEINLPYKMDEKEAEAEKVDTKKAVLYDGTYYFYNLQYEISNDVTFVLPMTGFFDSWTNYLGIAAALLLLAAGAITLTRRKPVQLRIKIRQV